MTEASDPLIESPPKADAEQHGAAVSAEEIRMHLKTILEGQDFRSSKRCQDFLTYVVSHALQNPSEQLKERTIGIEAFGRPLDYDTNADGVVRIKASEVRKRLSLHYVNSGRNSSIHISIPAGSYIPQFRRITPEPAIEFVLSSTPEFAAVTTLGSGNAKQARQTSHWGRRWTLLLLFAAILLAAGVFWKRNVPKAVSPLQDFWQPLLNSGTPIVVATAYAPVYLPKPNSMHGPFNLLNDQYVGGGDLIAAVKISTLLTTFGHPYSVRMGTAVTLDDLRNTPTVLIGYSSTQWSELTRNFRYFIDDSYMGMIRDSGAATDWYPHNRGQDYHVSEDYALVSRAFDPQTHALLILVSGCTQYGTEGAARLVTDPDMLAAALRGAPPNWAKQNLQLVLRIDMVANAPATAKVIASYYW